LVLVICDLIVIWQQSMTTNDHFMTVYDNLYKTGRL